MLGKAGMISNGKVMAIEEVVLFIYILFRYSLYIYSSTELQYRRLGRDDRYLDEDGRSDFALSSQLLTSNRKRLGHNRGAFKKIRDKKTERQR